MKRYIDGGEALLEAFCNLGVDYILSSPGSEWAPVWEALVRRDVEGTAHPTYIDCWHETVAVGMANGYALVTGRMQAVLLHAGPGLLQGACAIHGALLSGSPMLVFSSESNSYGERPTVDPGSQWYRNLSIVGGPHVLAQPFVKWANQVPGIETLYEMVLRTGEMSQRDPKGPVYLNVAVEILLQPWEAPARLRPVAPASKKITASSDIEALARLLIAAKNPVIMTETAGRDAEGFDALVELSDLLAIPVIEPQSAVCANFPRRHAMHLGGGSEAIIKEADLVLLVNCRAPWYPPSAGPAEAKTAVIDEVPQRPHIVYQVLHADLYLEGDVPSTIGLTADAVRELGINKELVAIRHEKFAAAHQRIQAQIDSAEAKAAALDVIDPVLLARALRELTDPQTIFVDETITHARVLQQHLQCNEHGRYYYVQGGLGQGIAVALGIKLAVKNTPVVLAVGDGSFLYNPIPQSLAAARDNRLPILIVIFNNKKYLSMKFNHLRFYPDGAAVEKGVFHGVDLATQPQLSQLAQPFGMLGLEVSRPADLERVLREALAAVALGRTAIVNVALSK
jgi:acetolactate synthase-1/2/3 large subunit